jgi:hypothetical protein
MMLYWKIRYLDRNDKQFKDRELFLDTESLPAPERAALELILEMDSRRNEREILKFRHLFRAQQPGDLDRAQHSAKNKFFALSSYFEDETGAEIKQHEFWNLLKPENAPEPEPPPPIPLAEVSLTPDEVRLLAYFLRDHKELAASPLMKEGPGTIHSPGEWTPTGFKKYSFKTALTDDEIRSTVTIYRRLYMEKEPANVEKAAVLFSGKLNAHPYARMVSSFAVEYRKRLDSPPSMPMFMPGKVFTFTTKQLIDIFLCTQYHHQPKKSQELQFAEYVKEVHGERDVLMCLFLWSLWETGIHIGNVGNWIDRWFQHFCSHHKVTPDVLDSLRHQGVGIGAMEKEEDRKARLFRERAEKLAVELWEQAGRPPGGSAQFLTMAQEELGREMEGWRLNS